MKFTTLAALLSLATVPALANDSSSAANTTGASQSDASIQKVLSNPSSYVGKQISLDGKVERILDANSFVLSSNGDSKQRILVVTRKAGDSSGKMKQDQQAGTVGNKLKDDQKVSLTGKVEMLTMTSEVDTINPQKDRATFSQVTTNTPIVVVEPGSIQGQG
jgi:uncharacterized protein YdeI (BOF family)